MPRFVLLKHDFPFLHWDLMLEDGEILRTWRLLVSPDSTDVLPAQSSFPHRLIYLDYEGPVSGNRGNVKRWDKGYYEGELPESVLVGDDILIIFHGKNFKGSYLISRNEKNTWVLTKHSHEFGV